MNNKPTLKLLLANPRGFCAGVVRAIELLDNALLHYPLPLYVRHAIVHNRFVVESFEKQGVIFVEDLAEVPDGVAVVFSAHGVAKSVEQEAQRRGLIVIDATCPLVKKVHGEAYRLQKHGYHVIVIGHPEHSEVKGIIGQLSNQHFSVINDIEQASKVSIEPGHKVGYVTQTTLSADDTADIIATLRGRFPELKAPHKDDICYATSNRQAVVKTMAALSDSIWIIGAEHSSNTQRLLETAHHNGCCDAQLIQSASDINWSQWPEHRHTLGLTASASAPEVIVQEVISACQQHFDVNIEEITYTEEAMVFKTPSTSHPASSMVS